MKVFLKRIGYKLTIISTLIIIIFNCIIPINVKAHDGMGGTLFKPIKDLVCGLADVVLNILQDTMMPNAPKAIDKRSIADIKTAEDWEKYTEEGGPLNFIKAMASTIDSGSHKLSIFTSAHNFLNNRWEDIKSAFTGNDPQYDTIKKFYENTVLPIILYSPATIFYNKVPALDVNFIKPSVTYAGGKRSGAKVDKNKNIKDSYIQNKDNSTSDDEKFEYNTAYQLRDTIAGWYNAFRDIAMVALLSVLVYVAIRIILSSTAGETAKYKQMLKDWVLALCLLFVMHYLMAFLLDFSTSLTNVINTDGIIEKSTGQDIFMEQARYRAGDSALADEVEDIGTQFGYILIYVVLVIYTLMFTWKYLMRLIYLAFLTMIAPLVAITYPIDKIGDGKAQAFQVWFREYVFNVLLQPMHMVLYTVLIATVSDFAQKNMIYALAAIGFLLPAEKLVKTMFGFNKADGGGLSAALTGASIFGTASSLAEKAFGKLPGGSSSSGSGGNSGGSGDSLDKIHYSRQAESTVPKGLDGFKEQPKSLVAQRGGKVKSVSGVNRSGKNLLAGKTNKGASKKANPNGYKLKKTTAVAGGMRKLGVRPLLGKAAKFGVNTIKGATTMTGRFIKKYTKPAIKTAGKIGWNAMLTGTGAMIGAAAGLATDDYSNIAKLGAAGAGAGLLAGKKTVDAAKFAKEKGAAFGKERIEDFKEGYNGPERYAEKMKEKANEKSDKEWKKDKDVIARFQREYGKEYKEKMDKAMDLRKAGITEQKDIESALNLMDKNEGLNANQAANIMNFSKGLDKKDLLNTDTRKNLRNKAKEMTGSDKKADKVMDLVDQKLRLK